MVPWELAAGDGENTLLASDPRIRYLYRGLLDADPETFAAAGAAARALSTLWNAQDDGVRRAALAAPVEDFEPVDEATGAAIYDAMRESGGADAEEQQ